MAKKRAERKWRRLEKLAAKIYQELQPDATVKHNDRIYGHESHTERQIDVSIRANVAGHELLVVVQTKDFKRAVNITHVGEFSSVIKDVRASKGVMICNAGFSKKAVAFAKSRGIDLCKVFDAESREWSKDLLIPVVRVHYDLDLTLRVHATVRSGERLLADCAAWTYERKGCRFNPLAEFVTAWNTQRLPRHEGREHCLTIDDDIDALIPDRSGCVIRRKVSSLTVQYVVEEKRYLRYCEPEEYRGIRNLSEDTLSIAALQMRIPRSFDESEWQRIKSKELPIAAQVAVFMVGGLTYQNVARAEREIRVRESPEHQPKRPGVGFSGQP